MNKTVPMMLRLLAPLPGALGLFVRSKLFPRHFSATGGGALFGAGTKIIAPENIRMGRGVIIDDHVLLDASGGAITLGDNCYLGRGASLVCRNGGAISLSAYSNFSTWSQLTADGSDIAIGKKTLFGPHTSVVTSQNSPINIGAACWLGAYVTVLGGVSVGDHTVVGAAAQIAESLPAKVIAVGTPARVVKKRGTTNN